MKKEENSLRINDQIRVFKVRLVGDNVEQGIYNTKKAMQLADELELDLVEINPNGDPPVCKIMDYNKYLRVLETTLSTEVSKTFSLSTSDHPGIGTKKSAFH